MIMPEECIEKKMLDSLVLTVPKHELKMDDFGVFGPLPSDNSVLYGLLGLYGKGLYGQLYEEIATVPEVPVYDRFSSHDSCGRCRRPVPIARPVNSDCVVFVPEILRCR